MMLPLFFYDSPCPVTSKPRFRLIPKLRAARVCLCRSVPIPGCSSERFQFDFLPGGGLPGAFRVFLRVSNYVRGIKCICDWFCASAERDAAVSPCDVKLPFARGGRAAPKWKSRVFPAMGGEGRVSPRVPGPVSLPQLNVRTTIATGVPPVPACYFKKRERKIKLK